MRTFNAGRRRFFSSFLRSLSSLTSLVLPVHPTGLLTARQSACASSIASTPFVERHSQSSIALAKAKHEGKREKEEKKFARASAAAKVAASRNLDCERLALPDSARLGRARLGPAAWPNSLSHRFEICVRRNSDRRSLKLVEPVYLCASYELRAANNALLHPSH